MNYKEAVLAELHNAYSHIDDIIESLKKAQLAAQSAGDTALAAHLATHIDDLMYPFIHIFNEFQNIAYFEGITLPAFMYPKMVRATI